MLVCQYVIACEVLRRPIPAARKQHIRRSLELQVRPDGGWGMHPDSPSWLFHTTLAYVALRAHDVTASPDTVWAWLEEGYRFFPEARADRVTWSYDHADSPWHVAFTPGIRALHVVSGDGEELLRDGRPTRVDLDEVRAKAAEQAARLFTQL